MGDDIDILRKIIAQGGRKYTDSTIDQSAYQRLVDAGWLNVFRKDNQEVIYEVTLSWPCSRQGDWMKSWKWPSKLKIQQPGLLQL